MLKNNFLLLLLILQCHILLSQTYTGYGYQDIYTEIEDYNSLMKETDGDIENGQWYHRFDLDFDFPFFDLEFDHIYCGEGADCSFDGVTDVIPMRLYEFIYIVSIAYDSLDDLLSDIRYKNTVIEGKKALVIQYTKVTLLTDPSIEEFDSFINFQLWFYEDGAIEIRIGETNLDNSPNYIPGEGFFLIFDNAMPPRGPHIELAHPYNKAIQYRYADYESHEEFEFGLDAEIEGTIDWLPPTGWVYRMELQPVSTSDINEPSGIDIFPNPVTDILTIDTYIPVEKIMIVNTLGQVVMTSSDTSIDLSTITHGMYHAVITLRGGDVVSERFIKN